MEFSSYEEFYPYYVGQHSKSATRWVHLAGTLTGFTVGTSLLARRRWRGVALMPVLSYGTAWASHFFIEKNKPATFKYPLWSLRGDFRMYFYMLTGRMNAEVEKYAAKPAVAVAPARAA